MILTCPQCHASNRVPISRLADQPRCGRCKTALGPVATPLPIESANEFRSLIGASPWPVLVDFWAPWCGPCRMVAPELEKLAQQKQGQLLIAKVNTEQVPELGSHYGVRSIPTMVLFRQGAEAHRISGAMPASVIVQSFRL